MKTFLVWREGESADDAEEILERSAEDAALEWAERDDRESADPRIAEGKEEAVLRVRDKATPDAKPQRFRVMGEYIPTYYADEEEEPTP